MKLYNPSATKKGNLFFPDPKRFTNVLGWPNNLVDTYAAMITASIYSWRQRDEKTARQQQKKDNI